LLLDSTVWRMTMRRPKRVASEPGPGYPSLEGYACERRGFLRRLFIGAVTLGVGSRALSACTSSVSIDGGREDPELLTVRLPGAGFASAYLNPDEYVRFAVTFTTYNEALAAYFRSHESEGLAVMSNALSPFHCTDFGSRMTAARAALAAALEDHYLSLHDDEGRLVNSLDLVVDTCEYAPPIGGVMEDPGYP
jgi:hypothetical protein